MFRRAQETDVIKHSALSRNLGEICGEQDKETMEYKIEESSIQMVSGQYDLHFIKMNGRLQVDLYNFFRRGELCHIN